MRHSLVVSTLVLSPVWLLATSMAVAGVAMAQPGSQQIAATATVQLPLEADQAIVYVALSSRHEAGEIAVRELAALRSTVVESLRDLGYAGSAVAPWGFGLGGTIDLGGPMIAVGPRGSSERQARQGVRVTVERLDELDAVLSALAEAGVDGIPLVRFESSTAWEARLRAVEQAVQQAKLEAEVMARAAGGRLGPLVRVSTNPDPFGGSSPLERMTGNPGFDRAAPLMASEPGVRVSVQGIWTFLPN